MREEEIIELFNNRDETVLKVVETKYTNLCKTVGYKVLNSEEDVLECFNDTLLALWNQIPPDSPNSMVAYISKIMRNQSLKKVAYNFAEKRNVKKVPSLDELDSIITCNQSVEDDVLVRELKTAINSFIRTQKEVDRVIFVRRYWLMEDIPEIANVCQESVNYISVHLNRMKSRLKKYLKTEGLIE